MTRRPQPSKTPYTRTYPISRKTIMTNDQISIALTTALEVIQKGIADRVDKKFEDGSKITVYKMGDIIRADIQIKKK